MKKITITTMSFIALLLAFSTPGICGNTQSIQVSCTIPEIPGVNAPLLMRESKIIQQESSDYETKKIQESLKIQQSSPMIQEDAQKNIEKMGNSEVMLETLYPR